MRTPYTTDNGGIIILDDYDKVVVENEQLKFIGKIDAFYSTKSTVDTSTVTLTYDISQFDKFECSPDISIPGLEESHRCVTFIKTGIYRQLTLNITRLFIFVRYQRYDDFIKMIAPTLTYLQKTPDVFTPLIEIAPL